MSAAIRPVGSARQYGRKWALRDCTLAIPQGHVAGLRPERRGQDHPAAPGHREARADPRHNYRPRPAPSGRTRNWPGSAPSPRTPPPTPSSRSPTISGSAPGSNPAGTTTWHCSGSATRPEPEATRRVAVRRSARPARPHPGAAKRPELLILDEPVASLDPLARREFLQGLWRRSPSRGLSVPLSSHLVARPGTGLRLLVVLVASHVGSAGRSDLLASAPPPVRAAP